MTSLRARTTKKPITRAHDSIYDGHYRQITPAEVEKATRVVMRHVAKRDVPSILTMLGIAS